MPKPNMPDMAGGRRGAAMIIKGLIERLELFGRRCVDPDFQSDPEIARMSQRELADLPLPWGRDASDHRGCPRPT